MCKPCQICEAPTGDSGLCDICRVVLDEWDIDIDELLGGTQ